MESGGRPNAGMGGGVISGTPELILPDALREGGASAARPRSTTDRLQVAQTGGNDGDTSGRYGGGNSSSGPGAGFFQSAEPGSPGLAAARTVEQERQTLAQLKQLQKRILEESASCDRQIRNGMTAQSCFLNVLKYFRRGLDKAAAEGSPVAIATAPVILDVRRKVRAATSVRKAVDVVREGVSKVRSISLVQSDDTVIAELRSQQRNVVEQTLASIEVDMARAVGL
ncbi:hypothetical protein [Hartmannibacter diazotrophicus]|nr:hypothetical protein [Hartmannibacter diazotrophicus]